MSTSSYTARLPQTYTTLRVRATTATNMTKLSETGVGASWIMSVNDHVNGQYSKHLIITILLLFRRCSVSECSSHFDATLRHLAQSRRFTSIVWYP